MPEHDHTVSALKRKRAELAGLIEHHQDQFRQAVIDLDNVDHTIRLFVPDIDLEDIRPKPMPPRSQAFKGEITRIILEGLRRSDKPLNARDLTDLVICGRGIPQPSASLKQTMRKRVSAALRFMRERGRLVSEKGPEGLLVWRIKEVRE